MSERAVPLLKQPMVLLVDSDPDVIDLTSTSYEESENEDAVTESIRTHTQPTVPSEEQSKSHVVEHGDVNSSSGTASVNDRATRSTRDNDSGVVQSGLGPSGLTETTQRRSGTPSSDFRELDNFFEGKVRSIGVDEANRLPVEQVLSRKRTSIQTAASDRHITGQFDLPVPQSTQKKDNSSSISTSTSSDSKKDNSTFISGIYNGINKVKNLLLPNSLFTQDRIEEENADLEVSQVEKPTSLDDKINSREIPQHTQIPSQDFKLPHPTSQSTRNTTLNTSSLELNSSNGQLPNQAAYYMQKQAVASSLVVPDSTTSLSSSSSQSQQTQPNNETGDQNLTQKADQSRDDFSSSSKKTLLPSNNEPLRSKNPLLQFSQVKNSMSQLKIKKGLKGKKTNARKVKKVVGSTDEEEEEEEDIADKYDLRSRNPTVKNLSPQREKQRISSYGLQTITTDKIGKITGPKTFVSEDIGMDDNIKIASSGGLFDDDDFRHQQKETENKPQERPRRTKTHREESLSSDEENFTVRRAYTRPKGFSAITLELSASENDAEIEREDSRDVEFQQVSQYLNVLEEQPDSDNGEKLADAAIANQAVAFSRNTDNIYSEESQATQSNVIDAMLNLYEEEYQEEERIKTFVNDVEENKSSSVECSHLFVPEDDNESEDSSYINGAESMLKQYLETDGKLENEEETEESGNTNKDVNLHYEDDQNKIIEPEKDKKKQISVRLMNLARHKRKKNLSEYNPYSDSGSSSDDSEIESDSSSGNISSPDNISKRAEDFIVNDDSVEFESDPDSGDELTKNEKITQSWPTRTKRKIEINIDSSDDEEQNRKQRQTESVRNTERKVRTRSDRVKGKKIAEKDVIILDSDSDESPDENVEAEVEIAATNFVPAIDVKTERDTSIIFSQEKYEMPREKQVEVTEAVIPLPEVSDMPVEAVLPKERVLSEELQETVLLEEPEKREKPEEFQEAEKHEKHEKHEELKEPNKELAEQNGTDPSKQVVAETDCIRCINERDRDLTEPCNRKEPCSNCRSRGLTCEYTLEKFTKNIEVNIKKSHRKQAAKKKKKAPKIIDNSLLDKLNERLRQKHERKMGKR